MSGYFKVSIEAARLIANTTDAPETLGGYVTLCSYAYGDKREQTAAGAKAIRKTLNCTDFRSKRVMADLQSLPLENGETGLIRKTNRRMANAGVYELPKWDGAYAYLPSLLVARDDDATSRLSRFLGDDSVDKEVIRDALLLLLHVYANTDYAEWFGCPPDRMAYRKWRQDGTAGDDFELGCVGDMGGMPLWLVAVDEDNTWHAPQSVMAELYGSDRKAAEERFWNALWCLKNSSLIVEVVSVQTGGRAYPLWVYSSRYRDSLKDHGIVPDLGRETQLAACATGLDPDNRVIQYAVDDCDRQGTGIFFAAGAKPVVRTVVAPRLHAPTILNLDGLKEAADLTRSIQRKIKAARRLEQEG